MRYPIETTGSTGNSLYFILVNNEPDSEDFGKVWNTTLNASAGGWEVFNGGHWSQYVCLITEYGMSGYYRGTFPANIGEVLCTEVYYNNPAPTYGDTPYTIGQSQGSNVAAVGASTPAALKFKRSANSMVKGTVIAGALGVSMFTTDIENTEVNAFKGRCIYFETGDLAGQGGLISAFDPDTGLITIAGSFSAAPQVNDLFVIG